MQRYSVITGPQCGLSCSLFSPFNALSSLMQKYPFSLTYPHSHFCHNKQNNSSKEVCVEICPEFPLSWSLCFDTDIYICTLEEHATEWGMLSCTACDFFIDRKVRQRAHAFTPNKCKQRLFLLVVVRALSDIFSCTEATRKGDFSMCITKRSTDGLNRTCLSCSIW